MLSRRFKEKPRSGRSGRKEEPKGLVKGTTEMSIHLARKRERERGTVEKSNPKGLLKGTTEMSVNHPQNCLVNHHDWGV